MASVVHFCAYMIRVAHISKSFGDLRILNDISFEVPKGQVACIVGKSGSGKSTLLQITGTLMEPDNGQVFIANQEASALRGSKLATFRNKHIGFVFQFHHLLPEFTALENAVMPALIGGERFSHASPRAEEWLRYLGLGNRLNHKPAALSGGEQQRVAVARALMNNPAVILADEPTGNLDAQFAAEMHDLFFQLRNEHGQTFLIVTHNTELAAMADLQIRLGE